ncbi:MAG: ABC transporter permease [Spirochaetaceae bacterium]|nr:ABC transporter permease [Spirochaetaceae bacterium]
MASFFVRLVKEKPLGFASGMVIVLLLLVAVFGGYVSPYPYNEIHLIDRLQGPSANYLLGTDQAGRDLLSRLIFGARISVLVGLAVTTISIVVSTLIGGLSGFVGGKLDLTVQRFVDAWNAFPGLLLLLTMMAIVGKGLLQIILVMGISGGIGGARVIRGAVIGIKENVYFDVAEAIGSPRWRSLIRHVVPNIMPVIIISFSTSVGGVIMALASLGFLGYGLPPNIPDWGGMLSRDGRKYMELAPRLALWPGLCLTVTIYSLNMFGDAVRDLLDPRLRGGGR